MLIKRHQQCRMEDAADGNPRRVKEDGNDLYADDQPADVKDSPGWEVAGSPACLLKTRRAMRNEEPRVDFYRHVGAMRFAWNANKAATEPIIGI